MPPPARFVGVVGGVWSLGLLALVVTGSASLRTDQFPPKSRARTVNAWVVAGSSGVTVAELSRVPCRTTLPSMNTQYQTCGPSSVEDHASVAYVAPTSFAERVGCVGGIESAGSVKLTLLLGF